MSNNPSNNDYPEHIQAHVFSDVQENDAQQNILKRNASRIGLAAFVLSGVLAISNPQDIIETKNEIKENAKVAYTVFPVTEGAAWLGAAMMLVSAGSKIGNPLTIKKRLSQVREDLNDNRLYRTGWAVGAIGAVSTSATIAGGAMAALPKSSWPVAFGISAYSLAFSTIPFKPSQRAETELDGGEK